MQIQFAKLLPSAQMASCPTKTPNVCNLIWVWLLWHHVSRLRLNQAHLDYQFPVASLSLKLVGGVVSSPEERGSNDEKMWNMDSSSTFPLFIQGHHRKEEDIFYYIKDVNTHLCQKVVAWHAFILK